MIHFKLFGLIIVIQLHTFATEEAWGWTLAMTVGPRTVM